MRNAYRIFFRKSWMEVTTWGTWAQIGEDNIKTNLSEIRECGLDSTGSWYELQLSFLNTLMNTCVIQNGGYALISSVTISCSIIPLFCFFCFLVYYVMANISTRSIKTNNLLCGNIPTDFWKDTWQIKNFIFCLSWFFPESCGGIIRAFPTHAVILNTTAKLID